MKYYGKIWIDQVTVDTIGVMLLLVFTVLLST